MCIFYHPCRDVTWNVSTLLEDVLKVSHGVSNIVLPLPNPPLRKVRGLDSLVSPQYIGGTKGGKQSYLISLYKQPLRDV
jgi:hypothetical protein